MTSTMLDIFSQSPTKSPTKSNRPEAKDKLELGPGNNGNYITGLIRHFTHFTTEEAKRTPCYFKNTLNPFSTGLFTLTSKIVWS